MKLTGDKHIASVRAKALLALDAAAETARQAHMAAGAGMALVYAEKLAQARDAIVHGEAPEVYPLLAVEIGITSETLFGVAQAVVTAHAKWVQHMARIEQLRLSAKALIKKATTLEAVSLASRISWPE